MVYCPNPKITSPTPGGGTGTTNSPFATAPNIIFEAVSRNSIDELLELLQDLRNEPEFLSLINYSEAKNGIAPIHVSTTNLNYEMTQLLLSNGANPNAQDINGMTPILNVLLKLKDDCQCEDCKRKAVKCINLLGQYNADMNLCDKSGECSPLYLSAVNGLEPCARALLNNGAIVGTHGARSLMAIFLEKIPDVVLTVFDRAVTMPAEKLSHEKSYELTFDMSVIIPNQIDSTTSIDKSAGWANQTLNGIASKLKNPKGSTSKSKIPPPRREMGFLSELLESSLNRDVQTYKSILQHPMVHVFADIKWSRLKFLYFAYMMMQVNFIVWYTVFLVLAIYVDCQLMKVVENIPGTSTNNTSQITENHNKIQLIHIDPSCKIHLITKLVALYVLVSAVASACKEILHCCLDFKGYIRDMLNYVQIIGLGTILVTLLIVLDPSRTFYLWLYPLASFGIGICWCQLFLLIGKLPEAAIYLEMLSKIVVNFCVSLGMYSFILVAFTTSYCMLFPNESKFSDFPLAFLRILTTMVGELNFETIFTGNPIENTIFAQIWYFGLVVVVSMVLMNLLVGLAVSDINGCRKNAELVVIQRRIRYLTYLEKSFFLGTLAIPGFFRNFLRKRVAIVVPDDAKLTLSWLRKSKSPHDLTVTVHPNDPKDSIQLTSFTKRAIKYWIKRMSTQKSHVGGEKCDLSRKYSEQLKESMFSNPNPRSPPVHSGKMTSQKKRVESNMAPAADNNCTQCPTNLCQGLHDIASALHPPMRVPRQDTTNSLNNMADFNTRRLRNVEYKMSRLENRLIELDSKLDRYFEKMMLVKQKLYDS